MMPGAIRGSVPRVVRGAAEAGRLGAPRARPSIPIRKGRPRLRELRSRVTSLLGAAAVGWAAVSPGRAAVADPPRFEVEVAPILRAYCWKCHGGEGRAGGLDMRSLPL